MGEGCGSLDSSPFRISADTTFVFILYFQMGNFLTKQKENSASDKTFSVDSISHTHEVEAILRHLFLSGETIIYTKKKTDNKWNKRQPINKLGPKRSIDVAGRPVRFECLFFCRAERGRESDNMRRTDWRWTNRTTVWLYRRCGGHLLPFFFFIANPTRTWLSIRNRIIYRLRTCIVL